MGLSGPQPDEIVSSNPALTAAILVWRKLDPRFPPRIIPTRPMWSEKEFFSIELTDFPLKVYLFELIDIGRIYYFYYDYGL